MSYERSRTDPSSAGTRLGNYSGAIQLLCFKEGGNVSNASFFERGGSS